MPDEMESDQKYFEIYAVYGIAKNSRLWVIWDGDTNAIHTEPMWFSIHTQQELKRDLFWTWARAHVSGDWG